MLYIVNTVIFAIYLPQLVIAAHPANPLQQTPHCIICGVRSMHSKVKLLLLLLWHATWGPYAVYDVMAAKEARKTEQFHQLSPKKTHKTFAGRGANAVDSIQDRQPGEAD